MQQVQGFSRLQTVPSGPGTAARPKLWILSSWRDLVLYVGTPLLLIPAFALAQAKWSPQDIYLFVAAFGAMGHHLPGMIQTYGFCRIYDAKTGMFDTLTRRLDLAMCLIWFATAVVLSPYRLSDTLDTYYMCGGPFIPPSVVNLGQNIILDAAIFVAVLFAAHFVRAGNAGHRP